MGNRITTLILNDNVQLTYKILKTMLINFLNYSETIHI